MRSNKINIEVIFKCIFAIINIGRVETDKRLKVRLSNVSIWVDTLIAWKGIMPKIV